MESHSINNESIEPEPKLLFKVTLMRHEKPYYKDQGHDLTPEGVEGALNTGKKLREDGQISENDEIFLAHSPVARAKGTLDFVAEGAGLTDKPQISIEQLRKSDIPDADSFMARVKELDFNQEKIAEDHYNHPMHDNRPDIIEPHSHKKERLYRTLEYLIRWFEKHPTQDKTPHMIAVSHFEIITHIIDDVFGIETFGKYNVPAFGEQVYIEAYETGSKDLVSLKVKYDSQTKEVVFNRKTRSIEVV
jgi:broad specificity phosphatase PhoE